MAHGAAPHGSRHGGTRQDIILKADGANEVSRVSVGRRPVYPGTPMVTSTEGPRKDFPMAARVDAGACYQVPARAGGGAPAVTGPNVPVAVPWVSNCDRNRSAAVFQGV